VACTLLGTQRENRLAAWLVLEEFVPQMSTEERASGDRLYFPKTDFAGNGSSTSGFGRVYWRARSVTQAIHQQCDHSSRIDGLVAVWSVA
jgi:hypothetical protein